VPPHDGVRLNEQQRRAPVAPDSGQDDQNSRSRGRSFGRLVVRLTALSCCRSAMFSRTNSWCPRQANVNARPSRGRATPACVDRGGRRGRNQRAPRRMEFWRRSGHDSDHDEENARPRGRWPAGPFATHRTAGRSTRTGAATRPGCGRERHAISFEPARLSEVHFAPWLERSSVGGPSAAWKAGRLTGSEFWIARQSPWSSSAELMPPSSSG
jgi:hypothetical protein